jgi:hypothetical protein
MAVIFNAILLSPVARCEDGAVSIPSSHNTASAPADPLLQLLVGKGVLNAEEAKSISGTPVEQRSRLVELLHEKGILSNDDYERLTIPSASSQVAGNLVASATPVLPAAATNPAPEPQAPAKPEPPKVVPAVVPLRVLQLEPAKQEGMIPDLKLGSGARIKLYGLIKASVIYDSSAPYGTDMPLPAFINTSISTDDAIRSGSDRWN